MAVTARRRAGSAAGTGPGPGRAVDATVGKHAAAAADVVATAAPVSRSSGTGPQPKMKHGPSAMMRRWQTSVRIATPLARAGKSR